MTVICKTDTAWQAQREQLWYRAGRRCECTEDCQNHRGHRCNRLLALNADMAQKTGLPIMDAHHVVTRGLGGGTRCDDLCNLVAACPQCHRFGALGSI